MSLLKHIAPKVYVVFVALVIGVVLLLQGASHTAALAQPLGKCLYIVRLGDVLWKIAADHNTTTQAIINANRDALPNPNLIYPDEHLTVCGGFATAAQAIPNPVTDTSTQAIREDIMRVFGAQYGPGAIRIAVCESGLNTNAWNPIMVYWNSVPIGHASGIFQIVSATWSLTPYAAQSVYDPAANIRAAYWLFARDGYTWRQSWSTWACAGY